MQPLGSPILSVIKPISSVSSVTPIPTTSIVPSTAQCGTRTEITAIASITSTHVPGSMPSTATKNVFTAITPLTAATSTSVSFVSPQSNTRSLSRSALSSMSFAASSVNKASITTNVSALYSMSAPIMSSPAITFGTSLTSQPNVVQSGSIISTAVSSTTGTSSKGVPNIPTVTSAATLSTAVITVSATPSVVPSVSGISTSSFTTSHTVSAIGSIMPACVTMATQTTASSDVVITQEETNFLRLTTLVLKVSPRAIRQTFNMHIHPNNLYQRLNTEQGKLKALKDKRVITGEQWKTLFPGHVNVSSNDFDLTLLVLLMREICGETAPTTGWNNMPPTTDQSEGADLVRIKLYRNKIAHANTCCISNYEFNNIFQDLNQTVVRRGGQGFTSEVTALLTAALDQSYKDLYKELKSIKYREIMPPNTQYLQDVKFQRWAEEDKSFAKTRASNTVTLNVYQNDMTIISGPAGSGKSATAHHIALQMQNDGYRICNIKSTKEIIDYWIPEIEQIFVWDDPFGVHGFDEYELNQWQKYQDDLKLCFQYSCMKIIATVRSHIAKERKMLGIYSQFQNKLISMDSENTRLSNEERILIFQNHAKNQNRIDLEDTSIEIQQFQIACFPLLCRIYAANKDPNHSAEEFFKMPISIIGKEISHLKENDPLKYFCLLLCAIYDNKLDSDIFHPKNNCEETKEIRETFLEFCELPLSTSRVKIQSALDTLLNTFLKKEGEKYHFLHDIVYDTLINHISRSRQDLHEIILEYCTSSFVRKRICLKSVTSKESEYSIELEDQLEEAWAKRLFIDIKNGHWYDVFENPCFKTEKGDEILSRSLEKLNTTYIEEIMCDSNKDEVTLNRGFGSMELFAETEELHSAALHWAVLKGLNNTVTVTVKSVKQISIHKMNDYENLLELACLTGNEHLCELLIDAGFNVNNINRVGITPLYCASANGHHDIINILIRKGADVNICDRHGQSAIYMASSCGRDRVLKMLIYYGADVNKCNMWGYSPLYVASYRGKDKAVKLLIENGAHVNKRDNTGCSPLYIASWYGREQVVKILIDGGANVNICNNSGYSPLFIAACIGNDKIIKLLTDNGADVNKCINDGYSPLYFASCNGKANIVKMLIDNGADVNTCTNDGWSPLYIASCYGRDEVVKMLIDNGADVNKCNNAGWSPLYIASCYGRDKIVNMLTENGADVNKSNNVGRSPLYIASCNGREKVVKVLIDNGADVNKCNSDGFSPLYIASWYGRNGVVKILTGNGADVNKCNNSNM